MLLLVNCVVGEAQNRQFDIRKTDSTVPIIAVVPEFDQIYKWDDSNGDTADQFLADDDNLYHFSCDGYGFGKEARNLCFNRLIHVTK